MNPIAQSINTLEDILLEIVDVDEEKTLGEHQENESEDENKEVFLITLLSSNLQDSIHDIFIIYNDTILYNAQKKIPLPPPKLV